MEEGVCIVVSVAGQGFGWQPKIRVMVGSECL